MKMKENLPRFSEEFLQFPVTNVSVEYYPKLPRITRMKLTGFIIVTFKN
jgi:hypothetical protein